MMLNTAVDLQGLKEPKEIEGSQGLDSEDLEAYQVQPHPDF